jgi:hypothetical protein
VPATARWSVNLQEVMGKLVWQLNFYDYGNGGGPVYATTTGVAVAAPAVAVAGTGVAEAGAVTKPLPPVPAPSCTPHLVEQPGWFNNSAQGMVDAENGTVIRFSRPTRSYWKQQVNDCAVPVPVDSPVILPPDAGTVVSPNTK